MRRGRRLFGAMVLAGLLGSVLFLLWAVARGRDEDLPWTALDLGETPGQFTGRKLAALSPAGCRTLLTSAGVHFSRLPPLSDGPTCGWRAAVTLTAGGARTVLLAPAEPPLACPVAAALAMWEWSVVQPAAQRYLGAPVTRIEHLGSYNCRHIAGSGSWSEHAHANAIDVAGFRLADGRTITVLRDWRGTGPAATFLRSVRNGACRVYATVLSPDYNTAHRDHLHLDQAARGAWGWRACR